MAWYCGYAVLWNEIADRELVPVGTYPELVRARKERAKHYKMHEDIHA